MNDNARGAVIVVNGRPYIAAMHHEGDQVRLRIDVPMMTPISSIEAIMPSCEHCMPPNQRRPIEFCRGCARPVVEVKVTNDGS